MSFFKKYPFSLTLLVLTILSTTTLIIYLKGVYEKIEERNQYSTQYQIEFQNEVIHEYLHKVKKDIFYFSELYTLHLGINKEPNTKKLEKILATFSKFNNIYSQIRYIDLEGNEFLRVNNTKGIIEIVSEEKLQNKANRYYFKDSKTLNIGEIYVSPFDLNVENGKIETPYVPTLRISTPLHINNTIKGYVIVNYAGDEMIQAIIEKNDSRYKTKFVNKDGYYMISPDKSKEWAFMFDNEITLAKDNKQLWNLMHEQKNGYFKDDKHYCRFTEIDPVEILSPQRKTKSRRDWFLITYMDNDATLDEFYYYLKSIVIMTSVFGLIIIIFSSIIAIYVKRLNIAEEEAKIANKKLAEADKLAALGQLIAGIAHEINSPLGAIKTSSSNTYDTMSKFIDNVKKIDEILTENEKKEYERLQTLIPKELTLLSIKEQRALKKSLINQLKEKNIPNERALAENLVNFNIEDLSKFGTLLAHKDNNIIFKTLNDEYMTFANLLNIQRSVNRASRTIFALKKFAHFDYDRHGGIKSIAQGIEDTITLLHHNLKQGVEVVRDMENLEPIFCYEDELVQIWMNLISNAIHAMNNEGTLTIKLYKEDIYQVVSIEDTGCGIPDEIQEKIFEPFFTTKEAGIGSGLGLDIVKKIVDAHQGILDLKSSNQGSIFYVKIPTNLKGD